MKQQLCLAIMLSFVTTSVIAQSEDKLEDKFKRKVIVLERIEGLKPGKAPIDEDLKPGQKRIVIIEKHKDGRVERRVIELDGDKRDKPKSKTIRKRGRFVPHGKQSPHGKSTPLLKIHKHWIVPAKPSQPKVRKRVVIRKAHKAERCPHCKKVIKSWATPPELYYKIPGSKDLKKWIPNTGVPKELYKKLAKGGPEFYEWLQKNRGPGSDFDFEVPAMPKGPNFKFSPRRGSGPNRWRSQRPDSAKQILSELRELIRELRHTLREGFNKRSRSRRSERRNEWHRQHEKRLRRHKHRRAGLQLH